MKDFILTQNQKSILKKIEFLKKFSFYLAGGTALALQFGHRTSKDFDFFTLKKFDSLILIREFRKIFSKEMKNPRRDEDSLWLNIKNIDISFFKYSYKLIRPTISYLTINLARPEDIATMKLEAIVGRGTKRDFIDIYYLMKKYSLKQILEFTRQKYSSAFNEMNYLYALTYFNDAETIQKDRKRIYLYKEVQWKDVKEYIETEVKKYQKSILRNKS